MRSSISSPSFRRQSLQIRPNFLPACNPMRGVAGHSEQKPPKDRDFRKIVHRSKRLYGITLGVSICSWRDTLSAPCTLPTLSRIGNQVADGHHAMSRLAPARKLRAIHSGSAPNAWTRRRSVTLEASVGSRTASAAVACKPKRPARVPRRTTCSAQGPLSGQNHYHLCRRYN
jgi:hypothetical protein